MKSWLVLGALLLGSVVSLASYAHEKRVHGEAEMEVVMEGKDLAIGVSGPLDSFLGFEHAPKNEKQKKALADMTRDMKDGGSLFEFNPEAGCAFVSEAVFIRKGDRKVEPAMLQNIGGSKKDGHADIEAEYTFSCQHPDVLKSITVRLFSRFHGLSALDVSMVLPKKQMAAELTPDKPQIAW